MRAAYIVPNRLPRYAARITRFKIINFILLADYNNKPAGESNVHPIIPPYAPAVGGNRSFEERWPNMAFHPLKNPRDNKIKADPRENVIANFEGLRIMIGKKTKKESKRRKTPTPANAAK